jgi:hypothetical protein
MRLMRLRLFLTFLMLTLLTPFMREGKGGKGEKIIWMRNILITIRKIENLEDLLD